MAALNWQMASVSACCISTGGHTRCRPHQYRSHGQSGRLYRRRAILQRLIALRNYSRGDLDIQVLDIFIKLVRDVAEEDGQGKDGVTPAHARAPVTAAAATTTTIIAVLAAATAAAVQIRQQCPDPADVEALEFYLMTLWNTFIAVSREVRYDHPLQDELVAVLEKLGSYAHTTVILWSRTDRLWRDYPLFGPFMREAWAWPDYVDWEGQNDYHQDEHNSNPNPRKLELCDQAAAWVNLNAFAARITGKGLVRWTWFGIIALTNGLEDKPPRVPSPWAPDAAAAVAERYRVVYEMHVQAASQWILLGGTAIFSDAFRGDCYDGERGHQITRPGKLYKKRGGRPGLDMTRWRFWRQRFEELGGGGGKARISDKVRAEALQAARRMDEIVARRLGTNDADGTV